MMRSNHRTRLGSSSHSRTTSKTTEISPTSSTGSGAHAMTVKPVASVTHRHLGTRIKEHQRCNQSAVYQHDRQPGHQMSYDNVEIIDRAETRVKLAAKEALHILKEKPTLNKQLNSQQSFDLKMLIIATHSAQY